MAMVTITFRNPITEQTMRDVQVDDGMTAPEVMEGLRQSGWYLPGAWRHVLIIKGKTQLFGEETLKFGVVEDGDVINVVGVQGGATA